MATRKAFKVQTAGDFDVFLSEFLPALARAVPSAAAQQVVQIPLDSIIRLTRATLPYRSPITYYLVDDDERVAWEEVDEYSNESLIIQMPKKW
jgi:hypothetical protein